jgi:hypothetical protein
MELEEKIEELEKYANLEGSELGELCQALIAVARYPDYCCSKKFFKAVEQEIDAQLKNFQDHCKIVDREEPSTRRIRELEWN